MSFGHVPVPGCELICLQKKMHLDFRLIPCLRNEFQYFQMIQIVSYGREMLPQISDAPAFY